MVTVTCKGLPELEAAATRTAERLDDDVDAAVREATDTLAKTIRGRAPVRSGRLRRSIRAEVKGSEGRVAVTATRSSRRYQAYPYPERVERQQPFFAPAVASVTEPALARAEDRVGDAAERNWGGR